MATFSIPVSAEPVQRFEISLTGKNYFIDLRFNPLTQLWVMDMLDSNLVYIFRGRTVVLGANLIRNTDPEKVPGALLLALSNTDDAIDPDFARLVDGRVTLFYADSV